MKLRNRKTGEIGYTAVLRSKAIVVMDENAIQLGSYTSLAELNKEWCDYEEPENFYIVEQRGTVGSRFRTGDEYEKMFKEIGNYFETKEEAEKAVEKLKALKRLKDNGMIKYSFHKEKTGIDLDFYTLTILAPRDKDSLDLLFGGEE